MRYRLVVQAASITISAPIALASRSGFSLCRNRFARRDPFNRGGFADAGAPADFEGFRRFATFDQLVKQAAADAVCGTEVVDCLGFHCADLSWKQKIPALTNQGRGGDFDIAIIGLDSRTLR